MMGFFVVVRMAVRLMLVHMLSLFLVVVVMFIRAVGVILLQTAMLMGIFFHWTLLLYRVRDHFMQPDFLS
jgi:hypothetical protein